jgi:YD repeat-containing protein
VSYEYSAENPVFGWPTPTGTVWVVGISEPSSGGTQDFTLNMGGAPHFFGYTSLYSTYVSSNSGLTMVADTDDHLRCTMLNAGSGPVIYSREYDNDNNITKEGRFTFGYVSGSPMMISEVNSTYGPHGNVLTQSTRGFSGQSVTSYYDASKYFQKESVTDANGNTSTFDYYDNADASPGNRGEVKWVRDARYGATGQQFEYTYNSYGQKDTETNLNDVVTEYTYGDTWGNLTEVVQDPGMGHLNRTTSMSYDVAGRVVSSTDPKSQSSSFAYNGVGQPTTATLPDETVSYGYGTNGRTESVTDDRGTTTMAYESGNDRVASVTDPVTGTVSYTYGLTGERLTMSLPGGGTWTYHYTDIAGRTTLPKDDPNSAAPLLVGITDDQGREVEYSLTDCGGLQSARTNESFNMTGTLVGYLQTDYVTRTSSTYGTMLGVQTSNGALEEVKNVWHYLDPMTYQWTSTVLVQNDYTYDDNGNRLTNTLSDHSGPIRTEEYGYDALNRLTGVDYGDGTTQGYTFDPMGNRLTKTQGSTESYTYNAANMLLSRGGNSYTNDANGNTLTGGGRTNTWDGCDYHIR